MTPSWQHNFKVGFDCLFQNAWHTYPFPTAFSSESYLHNFSIKFQKIVGAWRLYGVVSITWVITKRTSEKGQRLFWNCPHLRSTCGALITFPVLQTTLSSLLNPSDQPNSWNLDVVISGLKRALPNMNHLAVASGLDHKGFILPNVKAFVFLMSAWQKLTNEQFPTNVHPPLTPCLILYYNTLAFALPCEFFVYILTKQKLWRLV